MIANPTQHKAREAEFHLRQAKEHYQSDDHFAFYLSAFLSAARSITFHMQKQYGKKEGFPEWYCVEKIKMVADSNLKYLNDARVEDVHRSPVHTGATRSISVGLDAILVREGEEDFVETKPEAASEDTVSQPVTLRRFFVGRQDTEVIEFCSAQLVKLISLVAKCEERYPNE